MKARQALSLLLALACLGLAACTDRAEDTDPGSVKPQTESRPAPADTESTGEPARVPDDTPPPAATSTDAAPASSQAEPAAAETAEETQPEPETVGATPPAPPAEVEEIEAEVAPAPQPVAPEEAVPAEATGEVAAPATAPAPNPLPAPDPAAATRSDPVPDELHGGVGAVEAEPDDIYFPNCAAAEAGGYSRMKQGEAGYRAELDENGNGVACE